MAFEIYLVGGAVRDEILGQKPKDLDFVVLAPSFDDMKQFLLKEGAMIYVESPEFVTIRCKHPKFGIADFACGRKESTYSDGRHPDKVEITQDIEADLARRDFTAGAMAKNMATGKVVDPFGGALDTAKKLLRCVGDTEARFNEDLLRPFRAFRFAVQKQFILHSQIDYWLKIDTRHADFSNVSTERIWEELHKAFVFDSFAASKLLFGRYSDLAEVIVKRGIWFEPTTKVKQDKSKQKNFTEVM